MQQTFFVHFQKLLSYTFCGGNVVRVLVHCFFFHCRSFHLALVPASILLFFQQQKMSHLFFIFRSRPQSPFSSLSFAGLPPTFSFSLSFSCSIFQICGHNKLKLNTFDNTDTKTICAFRFRLY